jgi:hypothetical protein
VGGTSTLGCQESTRSSPNADEGASWAGTTDRDPSSSGRSRDAGRIEEKEDDKGDERKNTKDASAPGDVAKDPGEKADDRAPGKSADAGADKVDGGAGAATGGKPDAGTAKDAPRALNSDSGLLAKYEEARLQAQANEWGFTQSEKTILLSRERGAPVEQGNIHVCGHDGRPYAGRKDVTPYVVTCWGYCKCHMGRLKRSPDIKEWGNGNCHTYGGETRPLADAMMECMADCAKLNTMEFCCGALRCTNKDKGEDDLRDWYGSRFDVQGFPHSTVMMCGGWTGHTGCRNARNLEGCAEAPNMCK